MCTAISWKNKGHYFGRTLDHTCSFGEEVTVTPRNFPLRFRHAGALPRHYAIVGMAHTDQEYPLYYDAVNEKGLAIAGLNMEGFTHYPPACPGKTNIAHFELIPWLLGQCGDAAQAVEKLREAVLSDDTFSPEHPAARLHWLIADSREAFALEALEDGLHIWSNPVGVLTNSPPFPQQLFQLRNFMHLTAGMPRNRFAPSLSLEPYSYGMGALGLPGDLSSQSRFIRAAFMQRNSHCPPRQETEVSQFFHILDTVQQPKGCTRCEDDTLEYTLYASCCDTARGIYYYSTYENRQIQAVELHREDLEGQRLIRYPLSTRQSIRIQNGGHEGS